jgi:hypothetical protein
MVNSFVLFQESKRYEQESRIFYLNISVNIIPNFKIL